MLDGAGGVAVQAQAVGLDHDRCPVDRLHRQPLCDRQGLRADAIAVREDGTWLRPGRERTRRDVGAIGEALSHEVHAACLSLHLEEGARQADDKQPLGTDPILCGDHGLDKGPRDRCVRRRVVVQASVRLDVSKRGAIPAAGARDEKDLLDDVRNEFVHGDGVSERHPPEALPVAIGRVRPDGTPSLDREPHGLVEH